MAMLKVPLNERDYLRGNPNAQATLVEYGDYQCPHCGAAHPIVSQVLAHYGPRLRFAYRHFPLTQVHPLAEPAAEVAEFAGTHGRFWEMHDELFEYQDQLGLPLFATLTRALGLPMQELEEALQNRVFLPKIQSDFSGGVRSGVNGTPSFFIGERRFDGVPDAGSLVAAIDDQFFAAPR
jgi:protein-disulfide isomerase